jgi:muconolactone D-isomerase
VEYLVTMTTHVPGGTSGETVDAMRAREAAHTRELAAQGHVLRLWRPPILHSLPLNPYLTTRTTKLTPHPSDPAAPGSRSER